MRKAVLFGLIALTAMMFALVGEAQRRRRGRGRAAAVVQAPQEPPQSAQIVVAMEGIQWGWTHDQVIEYYRLQIGAHYQPLLRNKGQVEQQQVMERRDREIQAIRDSYITFNNQTAQRRWDSSYIAEEYTHGSSESMIVREDPENNTRDFYFFFNDRLWKRFQSRTLPSGSGLDFTTFAISLEAAFGESLKRFKADAPDVLETALWQDDTTSRSSGTRMA